MSEPPIEVEVWRATRGNPPQVHQNIDIKIQPLQGEPHRIQVYVSPSGRSVRVFRDGRELE